MRQFINIVETAQTGVPVDMLPASVKADILDMCLGPNGPKSFTSYWDEFHGAMSFNDTYVSQFLFGDENLSKTGGYNGDTIAVDITDLDPRLLYRESRSVSAEVVHDYASMDTAAPPVLVRKTTDGWKLVEGGHRIAAAVRRGTPSVQAVDVTSFWNTDWEDM